jgi:iron complex outermembrane receptor protein
MMKNLNTLLAFGFFFLLGLTIQAQTTVSGTVSDGDGIPLIGASVVIQGTTTGTTTDIDGNFSLRSNTDNFTIEISYTGFTAQSIDVSGNTSGLSITLDEGITLGGDIVISASRKREKVQEAPASVSVLTARKLETSANATDATRNLVNLAGVQVQQQSANRINISMRGGAGLFGTSVFPIMDYRSLVGPGIGTFQTDQAGILQLDLERIEVVRGPGSALYGPGVTQGVVHFITKSPIDRPGTSVELMGGELATFGVAARHATKVSDKFGFKINAQYFQGDEFTLDPNDPDDAVQIARFQTQIVQPAVSGGIVDVTGTPEVLLTLDDLDEDGDGNPMQNNWFNTAINTTLEFRPNDDLNLNLSGGFNSASSVFYNEQGEGRAYAQEFWGQARMQWKGLFAQAFFVDNNGGDKENPTFLYQTGNRTPVGRTQLEAQLQYNFDTPSLLNANWTAGFDYRFAGQQTENLVYGRNEDDDDFSVVGGYVQSKFELADQLDLVAALRYDQFNFIDDGALAPRAALVYKMNPKHTFRGSYNRSNTTVSNLQLNIDFPLSTIIPGSFDVWLFGNKTEQTFKNPRISWFTPLIPDVPVGTPGLPLGVAHGFVGADVQAGIEAALGADPNLAPLLPIFTAAMNGIDPTTLGTTGNLSGGFNIFDGSPLGLTDAPISKISTEDNYEIGYKGLIADKLGVSLDIYHVIQKNNSQFTAISPAYVLSGLDALPADYGAAVASQLIPNIEAGLLGAGLPQAQVDAIINGVSPIIAGAYQLGGDGLMNTPNPAFGGLTFAQLVGALPFHATSPTDQVPGTGGNHLAAGYRTFDERSFTGIDLGLEYYFTNDLSGFFNYSWVNDNQFMQKVVGFEDQPALPTYLNIPQNKFRLGVNYNPEVGFNGSIAFQHDDPYVASAGQFSTDDPTTDVIEKTDARNLIDLGLGYNMSNGLGFSLAVTNALNNEYRYLPNMPKIGRRAIAKVRYTFGVK